MTSVLYEVFTALLALIAFVMLYKADKVEKPLPLLPSTMQEVTFIAPLKIVAVSG
jgi:hypothetical protein